MPPDVTLEAARGSLVALLRAKVDDFRTRSANAKKNRGPKPPRQRGGGHLHSKPYRKATRVQIEERITEVITMIASAYSRRDIIRAFRSLDVQAKAKFTTENEEYYKYDLDWRTIDVYIRSARTELLRRADKTKPDAIMESVSYWESVIKNPKANLSDKAFARKRLDEIYGIDSPKQMRVTTPNGQPIEVRNAGDRPLLDVPLERLRQLAYGAAIEVLDVEGTVVKNGNGNKGKH